MQILFKMVLFGVGLALGIQDAETLSQDRHVKEALMGTGGFAEPFQVVILNGPIPYPEHRSLHQAGSDALKPDAALTGRLLDKSGASIPGVVVRLERDSGDRHQGPDSPARLSTVTDDAGRFALTGLAGGRYLLALQMAGFPTLQEPIELGAFDSLHLRAQLPDGERITIRRAGSVSAHPPGSLLLVGVPTSEGLEVCRIAVTDHGGEAACRTSNRPYRVADAAQWSSTVSALEPFYRVAVDALGGPDRFLPWLQQLAETVFHLRADIGVPFETLDRQGTADVLALYLDLQVLSAMARLEGIALDRLEFDESSGDYLRQTARHRRRVVQRLSQRGILHQQHLQQIGDYLRTLLGEGLLGRTENPLTDGNEEADGGGSRRDPESFYATLLGSIYLIHAVSPQGTRIAAIAFGD